MKTSSKKISDTRVEIKVTLDEKDLKKAEKLAIERLAKELKLSGFRKGKVPAKVAEQHLDKNAVQEHTLDIAVRTTVPKAFESEKETAIMVPKVEVTKFVPGQEAEYTATADVLPEIKLGDYKHLKVKKPEVKTTEKDVQDVLDRVTKAYAEKKAVKRKAKNGDEVLIDFTGTKDGKPFEGGSAKNHTLELGSKTFIPGFEEGIIGHEPGDSFEIDVTFPKDYHVKDLAGKKAKFSILIKQLNEITIPKQDDELAKKCGPFKTIKELKADIKKNLDQQNQYRADQQYQDALVTELVKKSKVSAPEVMIEDQMRMIRSEAENNANQRRVPLEQYIKMSGMEMDEWEKQAKEVAEQRVKASLCLQVLARDNKIEVDDDLVSAKMAELKEVYKNSPEAMKNLSDPRVRQDVKNRMTIEKTVEFLVDAQD